MPDVKAIQSLSCFIRQVHVGYIAQGSLRMNDRHYIIKHQNTMPQNTMPQNTEQQ